MRVSQAAASRPSGDRDPGGAGAGPSRSELQRERSAEPGSSGSSRNTQPTASARKPAHAEPRHRAM